MKQFFTFSITAIIFFSVAFSLVAFDKDCKHIYVAVEQPEIKIKQPPSMRLAIFDPPKTGKHDGRQLVCVKCFKTIKQVIDYGNGYTLDPYVRIPNEIILDTLKVKMPDNE